ncbi:MAG TPA: CU044_2847 family protein [Actinoplanes sp.]|jgi:hypothetical protein
MSTYIELPIDDDQSIYVEIEDDGLVHAGARDGIEKTAQRLDEAIGRVVTMGGRTIEKARSAGEPPSEVVVELGLKLTAKTGFVVAESTGEAQFKVTLRWALDRPVKL